jgi:hypothetical protein
MTTTTGTALTARTRARDPRLANARERRLRLDPARLARDLRIDEDTLDVEEALVARTRAQTAMDAAELAVAAGIGRLLGEKLTLAEVTDRTGLDQATVRRLRQLKSDHAGEGEST